MTEIDVSSLDLPPLSEIGSGDGGGKTVSTQAECSGCEVTASLEQIENGEHDFAVIVPKQDENYDTHITAVHICSKCGTLGATIVTKKENIETIQEAINNE